SGSSGVGGVRGESAGPASGAPGAGGQDPAGGSSSAGSAAAATGGSLSPDLVEQICGFIGMAGEAPAPAGSEFYAPELDPDGDGLACD
ncbi:MAG: excalibur calcium-binding domain-containing protein, partial [Actinomycetota bacterium]|nr:excalibur calcium-binding domain-containing protein [Actinomycetota bacterium]